jgi:hypothetical protein
VETCTYCKRTVDPNDAEAVERHETECVFAALPYTVGAKQRVRTGPPIPYKTYRPKRRKKSSFKG